MSKRKRDWEDMTEREQLAVGDAAMAGEAWAIAIEAKLYEDKLSYAAEAGDRDAAETLADLRLFNAAEAGDPWAVRVRAKRIADAEAAAKAHAERYLPRWAIASVAPGQVTCTPPVRPIPKAERLAGGCDLVTLDDWRR